MHAANRGRMEWQDEQAPTAKEEEVEEFLRNGGEVGDHATYFRPRVMASESPRNEVYDMAASDLARLGPSFARRETPRGEKGYGGTQPRRHHKESIQRGRKIPMGDCEAQESTMGIPNSRMWILGDTIRISDAIQKETKNLENRDPNQCVLLYRVAGTQSARTKRQQGAPVMQNEIFEAEEWRRGEIPRAHQALEWCVGREGHVGEELRSLANDVLDNGRDRDYRGVDVFPRASLAADEINIPVFDLRAREEGGYELRVSSIQITEGEQWLMVDFLECNRHMRWMKPCSDIHSSAKREWGRLPKPHLQLFTVEGWKAKCRLPADEVGNGRIASMSFLSSVSENRPNAGRFTWPVSTREFDVGM